MDMVVFTSKRRCKLMTIALSNELVAIRKLLNERPLLPLSLYIQDINDLLDDLKIREKVLEKLEE